MHTVLQWETNTFRSLNHITRGSLVLKEFAILEEIDIEKLIKFNNDLSSILEAIDSETIISESSYSESEFVRLLVSFVQNQRKALGRTKEGSWSIVPNDDGMDSDARVEFIFKPTYYVTAILSRSFLDYSKLTEEIPGYLEALKAGMVFCSYRGLFGHGYEADAEAAEALTILALGKIPAFLEQRKDFCSDLYCSINKVMHYMEKKINSNSAFDDWGGSLQDQFSSAVETYLVKNDRTLYETIIDTDNNPDSPLCNEEDLPW